MNNGIASYVQEAEGLAFPRGPQGAQGIQGPQGIQGAQGIQGPKGDTGAQGIQGPMGPQGIQGLKGESGVYLGSEEPTDEDINVWINPNGTPEISAENLIFSDNKTLQEKYDDGSLQGPRGAQGIQGPQGETGPKGETGPQGIQGEPGHTPIKGVDYFTQEDINSLNIPTKTSELTNDSNFATESYVEEAKKEHYSTEEQVIGTWKDGKPLYRKVISTTLPSASGILADYINDYTIPHGISNFKKCIKSEVIFNESEYNFPYISVTNGGTSIQFALIEQFDSNNLYINITQNLENSFKVGDSISITLEYTKATD